MREPREYENPLCAEIGGDFWFPEKEKGAVSHVDGQFAKSICGRCTHRIECAEWGIHKEAFGIWGGLAPRERLSVRRDRRIILGGDEEVA
jgi:predicted PP-loop superfamily ATPase